MSRPEISIPVFNEEDVVKFRGAVLDSDEPELYAYRTQAHLFYDELVHPTDTKHTSTIIPESFYNRLSNQNIRIPTVALGDGCMMYDIRTFIHAYPSLAQKYIFDAPLDAWKHRKACAFIESCWNSGIVFFVPPNTIHTAPLDMYALLQVYHPSLGIEKIIVIVESNAHITVIDKRDTNYLETPFVARAIDYHIGDYASATIISTSTWDDSVYEFGRQSIYAGTRSRVRSTSITAGAAHAFVWLDCFLRGRGAEVRMYGAYALHGKRHVALSTTQHHMAADTESEVLIKSCLDDNSYLTYSGMITIASQASQSRASQRNMNLMMSPMAHVRSVPSLEVVQNDVQCTHGSAIGSVDEEQVLYLQSRGISRMDAERMIVQGFLREIIDTLPSWADDSLRTNIHNLLFQQSKKGI
jgi:Fe-S cluster assembly protein SufD